MHAIWYYLFIYLFVFIYLYLFIDWYRYRGAGVELLGVEFVHRVSIMFLLLIHRNISCRNF